MSLNKYFKIITNFKIITIFSAYLYSVLNNLYEDIILKANKGLKRKKKTPNNNLYILLLRFSSKKLFKIT